MAKRSPGSIPKVSSSTNWKIQRCTTRENITRIRWTPCACPSPTCNRRMKSRRSSPCCSAALIPLCRPNICTSRLIAASTYKTAGGSSQNIIASAATRLTSAKNPCCRRCPCTKAIRKVICLRCSPPKARASIPNGSGVRQYLQVRMPTFSLSNDEIRKLTLFFEAMSAQPDPFIPPKVEPLNDAERAMARGLFTSPAAPCLKCHMTGNEAHDKNASAPNFLLAHERLQPAWTARWITDPAKIIPGTAMPSGLFRKEGDVWVFAGPTPGAMQQYHGDQADLLVRYMFTLTPQEQAALLGRTPSASNIAAGKQSGGK